ncbi:MAG: choice-of-anchor L domain-containing protein, partial [Flavobacteriaceae bacterium]
MKLHNFWLLLVIYTASINLYSQNPISTNNTTYTPEQLIEDILITGDCANTANYSSSIVAHPNGIAYFERDATLATPNFPFANGIVLSTGNAMHAPGPESNTSDTGVLSAGDTDLENIAGITNTNDASYLEFDFTPPTSEVSFNYLFVSEEYNQNFECTYSDAFAFILTDLTTGTITNLAVLPNTNTGSLAVSCTNVRPEVPNSCNAANEQYFDYYNFDNTDPTVSANSPISYGGQTVPLTATATVTPGNTYRIKLVIADQGDSSFDSAVFLEGGSFGLGINLNIDGLQIINGVANACDGDNVVIEGEVDASNQLPISYQWQQDGVDMTVANGYPQDENTPTLTVNTPATYTLTGFFSFPDGSSCSDSQSIEVNFYPPPFIDNLIDLTICDANTDGTEEFMLTDNNTEVLGTTQNATDFNITYHSSEQNAIDNATPLASPYTNTNITETIWVRIENANNNICFTVGSFQITVGTATTATQPANPIIRLCDIASNGSEFFDLTQFEAEILNTQDPSIYDITYHLNENNAIDNTNAINTPDNYNNNVAQQTIWVRVQDANNDNCFAVTSFEIFLDVVPVANALSDLRLC